MPSFRGFAQPRNRLRVVSSQSILGLIVGHAQCIHCIGVPAIRQFAQALKLGRLHVFFFRVQQRTDLRTWSDFGRAKPRMRTGRWRRRRGRVVRDHRALAVAQRRATSRSRPPTHHVRSRTQVLVYVLLSDPVVAQVTNGARRASSGRFSVKRSFSGALSDFLRSHAVVDKRRTPREFTVGKRCAHCLECAHPLRFFEPGSRASTTSPKAPSSALNAGK